MAILHEFPAVPIEGTRGWLVIRLVEGTSQMCAEAYLYGDMPTWSLTTPEYSDAFFTVATAREWAERMARDYLPLVDEEDE